jgi:hypothetical protein
LSFCLSLAIDTPYIRRRWSVRVCEGGLPGRVDVCLRKDYAGFYNGYDPQMDSMELIINQILRLEVCIVYIFDFPSPKRQTWH